MRIKCPLCGERDSREFHYRGSAKLIDRPLPDEGADAMLDYVYIRDNPAGDNRELWFHEKGCRAWLVVVRNVATHEFRSVELVAKPGKGAP